MEGQDCGVDTEEGIPTQHFHVTIFEVEGLMRDHRCRVERKVVIGGIRDRGGDRRLVIGSIRDRKIGESSDADGRRLDDGSDGRFRD